MGAGDWLLEGRRASFQRRLRRQAHVVGRPRPQAPKPIRSIEAHKGWIRSIDVSPDGTLIATGGNDNLVRLWNAADGKLVRELPGHERHVYSVAFHPAGQFLLSGDLVGVINQWEVASGKVVRAFDAKPLHTYEGGQQVDYGGVRAMAVSPDGKWLAAGGLYKGTNPLGAVNEPLVLLFNWESQKTREAADHRGHHRRLRRPLALARRRLADGRQRRREWRMAVLLEAGRREGVSSLPTSSRSPATWTCTRTACRSQRPTTISTCASRDSRRSRRKPSRNRAGYFPPDAGDFGANIEFLRSPRESRNAIKSSSSSSSSVFKRPEGIIEVVDGSIDSMSLRFTVTVALGSCMFVFTVMPSPP